jgi:hypothetical protein
MAGLGIRENAMKRFGISKEYYGEQTYSRIPNLYKFKMFWRDSYIILSFICEQAV